MTQFPINNLPTASQTWRQSVESSINTLELQVDQNNKNNDSRDKNLKTSIDSISAALVRAKTGVAGDYKIYTIDGNNGGYVSHPPVLSFIKPDWANSATVIMSASVSGICQWDGVALHNSIINAYLKMFINSSIVQSTTTTFNSVDGGQVTTGNYITQLVVGADSTTGTMPIAGFISQAHTESLNVTGATLDLWASFNNTLSNEIPPLSDLDPWWLLESVFDPGLTNQEVWNYGLRSQITITIAASVNWNVNPV
jgi:hypothetical protein